MDISVALIRRCKNKDREAFNLLFSRCEEQLFKLCFSYARDKETALDIMQEVYIKVFRSIETFDENRLFLPWLKKIAANTCINYYRDHSKQHHMALEFGTHDGPSILETFSPDDSLEDRVINRSLARMISDAIGELPESYRLALSLRYLDDMPYKSISETLDLPLGTVKSNIARGRELLKKRLQSNGFLEV